MSVQTQTIQTNDSTLGGASSTSSAGGHVVSEKNATSTEGTVSPSVANANDINTNDLLDSMIAGTSVTHILHIDPVLRGVTTGLMAAVGIFIATILLVIKGGPNVGAHLNLLSEYFIGYRVTWLGAFVGAAYGLVTGFISGYLVAVLYNNLSRWQQKARTGRS